MLDIEELSFDKYSLYDEFIQNNSLNGLFIQTRRFLDYHKEGKFIDKTLLIYDKNKLVAVVPGCQVNENMKKIFYSHPGTSYGGIIIDRKYYLSDRLTQIIECLDDYLSSEYDGVVLKNTPDIFCEKNSDLLKYLLWKGGYDSYNELSTYVDVSLFPNDVREKFDRNKNRNIKKCIDLGLSFRALEFDEIEQFYNLLCINLSKHGCKPIHSLADLLDLKGNRFNDEIIFLGVCNKDEIVAAGMLFDFNHSVLHAQNLSYDINIKDYSPITFLYYKVIEYAKINGFRYVSWGISTEEHGKILNYGLIRNKESYGSMYQINSTFIKEYR